LSSEHGEDLKVGNVPTSFSGEKTNKSEKKLKPEKEKMQKTSKGKFQKIKKLKNSGVKVDKKSQTPQKTHAKGGGSI
jgi:hypothetical protein